MRSSANNAVHAGRRRGPRWAAVAGFGALVALAAGGCGGKLKSPTEPAQTIGPALSFATIQATIFSPTCAKSGCHNAGSASAGLVLEAGSSYGNLVNHISTEDPSLRRVAPGNPGASYLLKKLRGDPDITGSRMPQSGPPFLSADQIAGIAGWIQAGAPNQ
jgi:hypothetical protein